MIYDNKNYSNKLETSYTNSDHKSLNEQAETTSSTSKRRSQVKNACGMYPLVHLIDCYTNMIHVLHFLIISFSQLPKGLQKM